MSAMFLLLLQLIFGVQYPPQVDAMRGPTCDDCNRPQVAPSMTIHAQPPVHGGRGRRG